MPASNHPSVSPSAAAASRICPGSGAASEPVEGIRVELEKAQSLGRDLRDGRLVGEGGLGFFDGARGLGSGGGGQGHQQGRAKKESSHRSRHM